MSTDNLSHVWFKVTDLEVASGEGSWVVTTAGDRYLDTYYSDAWLAAGGYDVAPHVERFERACATGRWTPA